MNLPERVKQIVFAVAAAVVLFLGWQIMGPSSSPSVDGGKPKAEESAQVVTPRDGAPQDSDEPVGDATKGLKDLALKTPHSEADLKDAASQAVQFVEMFDSYRWDSDLTKKLDRIRVLLAKDHTVRLEDVNPQGSVAKSLRESRAVTSVKPTGVALTLMGLETLVFEVEATATSTSTVIKGKQVSKPTYEITMVEGSSGWGVMSFAVTGDETTESSADEHE